MVCDRRHRLPSLVRSNNTTLYRENGQNRIKFSDVPGKFMPAGEPSVLYCSAIAPLARNEGHQGTPCSHVHGSSGLKENYSCKARHFPSD
jgi:hypothetical protein